MANDGLSAEERAAVKQRARELRAQEKAGKSREAGTKAVLDAIAELSGPDEEIARGLHELVSSVAPDLVPKTYYGMPGYANSDGKVVLFMQPAGKFKTRYPTIGFQDLAYLDTGDIWPVAFGIESWSPAVTKKLTTLVRKAGRNANRV